MVTATSQLIAAGTDTAQILTMQCAVKSSVATVSAVSAALTATATGASDIAAAYCLLLLTAGLSAC